VVRTAEDMKRLEVIRDVIGSDNDLMVDVNRVRDLATATEAIALLLPLKPGWLEEPVRWADDRRELKLLSRRTRIPLSAGESELTSYGCRTLLKEQAIQILQFDCTMFGGFTEGRKLAAACELNHVQIAPHHDCFIHAPLVASTPAGCIVESFPDPERDPLQAELFENPPSIAQITPSDSESRSLSGARSVVSPQRGGGATSGGQSRWIDGGVGPWAHTGEVEIAARIAAATAVFFELAW
jgi:L-alanine-DL-glutamate epimerase-like enolase superfamily enzyme